MAEGVDGFVGFQDDLLRLQAEIQRDIGALKKTVRKDKQALPPLEYLRRLRWYARCLGDALAWQVLLYDRKAIAALTSGTRPPIAEITPNTQAVVSMAGYLLSQGFGVPIVHDVTNWLRIGDITFMLPGQETDEEGNSWRFQTVELKTTVHETEPVDERVIHAKVTVNMYCNENMDLPQTDDKLIGTEIEAPDPTPKETPRVPARQDRRLKKQFRRLDQMIKRRDMDDNAITTIDGIPNIVIRVPHADTHHWPVLRRAIRDARRNGFAFFSIDGYVGYGIFYRKEGVTEEHIANFREPYVAHFQNDLLGGAEKANGFLMVREIPMKEEYDIEGFPIMRFFNYKIPKMAIQDLLHHRLVMTAVVNWGRVDHALVDEGFAVAGINATEEDQPCSYSVEISWPTGDRFRVETPSNLVSREVERALYEFAGLNDVVQKIGSVKLLPELISYEDWDASLKAQSTAVG